jgi:hypothetical protein
MILKAEINKPEERVTVEGFEKIETTPIGNLLVYYEPNNISEDDSHPTELNERQMTADGLVFEDHGRAVVTDVYVEDERKDAGKLFI